MNKKKQSQKQEKTVAKELNAKTVIASGALWASKGDVRNDEFLVECKTTEKPYYIFNYDVWRKIELEALKDGMRVPVMSVDVSAGVRRYAIVNETDLLCNPDYEEKYLDLIRSTSNGFENIVCEGKSFRLRNCCLVTMKCFTTKRGGAKTLCVLRWKDFLDIIKKGE